MNPQPAHNEECAKKRKNMFIPAPMTNEQIAKSGDPHLIETILNQRDAHAKALEEKLQDYKDTYDPVKSGLRADEVHCACAYELRATIDKLQPIVEKVSMIKHIHRMEDPCTVVCSLADEAKDALSGCAAEHNKNHKTVLVSYRDGDYEECTECDYEKRIESRTT